MAPALRKARRPSRQKQSGSSRPARSSRNAVKSYREESSDNSDEEWNVGSNEGTGASPPRPSRAGRQPQTYREISTDSGSDNNDSEPEHVTQQQLPDTLPASNSSERPKRSKRPAPSARSPKSSKKVSPRKRRCVEQGGGKGKGKQEEAAPVFPEDSGVIPPWNTLPYLILFDIFVRASQPLYDVGYVARQPSIQWLLDISRLCRSFYEPAMAALYYSPPLFPASRSHGLLNLLAMPQEHLTVDYRCLIKQLDVDVPQLLFYKMGPSVGYFDLGKLVELTPQLRYLHLYHRDDLVLNTDEPPPITTSRWAYPLEFFETLEINNIRLRSWDWNARFLESPKLLQLMGEVHLRPVFRDIQELTLYNISGVDEYENEDLDSEQILATALSSLPNLRALYLERCSLVADIVMSSPPANLQILSITNCTQISSDTLGLYLSSHGHCLEELHVAQNRHLNLTFMINLAEWCPQLKALSVDLTFYDSRFRDVEPHFDHLLLDADVPSWPSTLQSIELNQLRKWNDKSADYFFTSLIDAAPNLPDLRRLIIKAILKIGWRDRATFRDKWIRRIESTFLRKSPSPDPNLRSVSRAPRSLQKEGAHEDTHSNVSSRRGSHSNASPTTSTRKSTRIARQRLSDMSTELSSRNNSRGRSRSESEISHGDNRVQGMCDFVLIRIDNLRPSEAQFKEADFLDDEVSGDDDWDGTDPEPGDGYAW
ncbi:hypothetical protein FQN54_007752 [Arachnomyces sp. PD_36]|nr:hypothetical protein FQN54_007752 [Arachnomyces sp. PD_36]